GIGTDSPAASAAFEVFSTTKGLLLPRMTKTQLESISLPVEGLMAYCTDCDIKGLYVYSGVEFISLGNLNSSNSDAILEILKTSSNPASDGTPSLADLTAIGIIGATLSQSEYEEAIAVASPIPTTLLEFQEIIDGVNDAQPILITSNETASDLTENSGAGQQIYTVTTNQSYDLTYSISGDDADKFTIDTNTGAIILDSNPDFEIQNSYTFNVTASNASGITSNSLTVNFSIIDVDDNESNWGLVRYILLRGDEITDNRVGEMEILNSNGVNLIDNGTLVKNDFTYNYAGGYGGFKSGDKLFDNDSESPYGSKANAINSEKWVLIDLNKPVEIGSITIMARSDSDNHIDRITHITLFASENNSGFAFTGTETGDSSENLVLDNSKDAMKLDSTLKWRDLNEFSSMNTSINYAKANIE
ncbi:MAG: cadherin repeat domain-containing protein, partial [Flavobacteriales bacterium]|nr:cadherin repeat domain-containing protein [Flavobacteriales bacterium]